MMLTVAAAVMRLAIYYGYPSLVEGSNGDIRRAAAVLGSYDLVVLGDGLELEPAAAPDPGLRIERERLRLVIEQVRSRSPRTQVYGYVDLGSSQGLALDEINRRIVLWRRAGADGLFFDEAGRDFGVTPDRLRAAVAAVHGHGMRVFLNMFDPGDLAPVASLVSSRDALLIESFAVRNGVLESAFTASRTSVALQYRQRTGIRVVAVTTSGDRPYDAALHREALRQATALRLDGFGWGEPNFGADARLPDRR